MSPYSSPGYSEFLGDPTATQDTALNMVAAVDRYLSAMAAHAAASVPATITPEFVSTAPPSMQDYGDLDIDLTGLEIELPSTPVAGTLTVPDALDMPVFTGVPPTFTPGTKPVPNLGAIPDAPGITVASDIAEPTINLPAPPNLLSLTIATFDGVTLPTFSETLPVATLVEPTVIAYTPGALYTSALLTALKTTLENRITTGGTGLAADVEEAIWNRAREREQRTLADALLDLERMETLGYAFPPGVYLDARLKLTNEFGKTYAGLSRDIAIKQAELELSNVQEALKEAVRLEGQLLDYTSRMEQRIFEATKYATDAGIAIYNAKVDAYKALLDAFKTKVAIYEAQIRGELAKVEVYKAQVDAERAKAEVNNALVNQYKVQVEAALANVEVYKVRVEAAQVKAQIEKLKIEMFAEHVRAYVAKSNAYAAEMEGYKAEIQAEVAKQEGYRTQVQAYAAQVDAQAKIAGVQIEILKSEIAREQLQWDAYKSQTDALVAAANVAAQSISAQVEIYKTDTGVITSYNDTLMKQYQIVSDLNQRVSELRVATGKANGDLWISVRQLLIEAAKTAATTTSQIGAAALNATNWSSSIALGESFSQSNAFSVSQSENKNENTNL